MSTLPSPGMTLRVCRFCGVAGREHVVDEDTTSCVLPSMGSLVPGWLLVVPNDHVISLAVLGLEQRSAFAEMVDRTTQRLAQRFGAVVQFEHGPAGEGRSAGCGVDHAHLHLVPFDANLREMARGLDPTIDILKWRQVSWPWAAEITSGHDYLFVRDTSGIGWFAEAPTVPSQLFRRVIARHLGQTQWDWKDENTTDMSAVTLEALTIEPQTPLVGSGTRP